jgi:glucose/arabinose dehydrogenase
VLGRGRLDNDRRVQIDGERAREIGRIDLGVRTRDVEQAPDGSIYVLTDKDNGSVLRLVPKDHKDVASGRQ